MLLWLVNDPETWRGRAEEARATAKQLTNAEPRRIMFSIAERYDLLADYAEKRLLKELPPLAAFAPPRARRARDWDETD